MLHMYLSADGQSQLLRSRKVSIAATNEQTAPIARQTAVPLRPEPDARELPLSCSLPSPRISGLFPGSKMANTAIAMKVATNCGTVAKIFQIPRYVPALVEEASSSGPWAAMWSNDVFACSPLSPSVINLRPSSSTLVSILEISAPMIASGAQPYMAHALDHRQHMSMNGGKGVLASHKGQ